MTGGEVATLVVIVLLAIAFGVIVFSDDSDWFDGV